MGVVEMEEFPYYAYRRYPFGARRTPVYNSSFPGHWSGDYSPYYENSMYGDNSAPIFAVGAPFTGDADLVRKRKLDGLKGEVVSSGDQNARNTLAENGSNSNAFSSKPVRSPAVSSSEANPAIRLPEPRQVHPPELKHSSASSPGKGSPHPRVISIPVIPTDEGKDNTVKFTVIPPEGTKKSKKVKSAEGAAVLIQSWFRGFQVRRTAPFTQLRHIAKVRSQFMELDEKASDVDFINYARENRAARLKLTEGIMKLLLQLDAIQGAHPVVREIRKLATFEVISLQGRVDALLSTEVALLDPSQLPMEIEEASRDDKDREIVSATESRSNDSIATAIVDADDRKDPRTQMAEPDPDQGNGEVGAAEGTLEPMESETVKTEITEVSKSAAEERERVECEGDQLLKAYVHHDSVVENESSSNLRQEDGEKLDEEVSMNRTETLPEAVEVTTVDAETVRTNNRDERAVLSGGNVSEGSPQESFRRNEQERGEIDDGINCNALLDTGDLSEPDDGDIHPLNAKDSSLPNSPRSPFEALDCLDFPASISDSELQSKSQASPETIQDGSAQGKAGNRALLLKLSEENKALKSLLVTVMKWNQMQATTMQEVNHRLGMLEGRMSPRIDKKSKSRRRGAKSSRMML